MAAPYIIIPPPPPPPPAVYRPVNSCFLHVYFTIADYVYPFQDNRVTFQLMRVSPYVADLTQTVEGWMKNLEQLEEILDLWVACQRKVFGAETF